MEIKNAKITGTMLGYEDHGILTCMIDLDYGGSGQGFGGYQLSDGHDLHRHITQILKTVGVEKWEDLKGKYVRVVAEHSKVHRIGNLLEEKWFDPKSTTL